jgi:hypothetical protein
MISSVCPNCPSEGFERIIQVPGCDDGVRLDHRRNLVSVVVDVVVVVVVARLGAALSKQAPAS